MYIADICRVCRSEGTPDKPLYHPCVCTGSIKFIHQEWWVRSWILWPTLLHRPSFFIFVFQFLGFFYIFYVHTFLFTSRIHTHPYLTSCMLLSVSFCSPSLPALLTFYQQHVVEIDYNFQRLFWSFSPTNSRWDVWGEHAVLNDITAAWLTLNPERRAPAGLH